MAAGNPATVKRGPEGYPVPLSEAGARALVLSVLEDYATTLASKGAIVREKRIREEGWMSVGLGGEEYWIGLTGGPAAPAGPRIISFGFGPARESFAKSCHFDLSVLAAEGPLSALAEDLRDFLRRRAIRIFTGAPFRTLPLTNLARLKAQRPKGRP